MYAPAVPECGADGKVHSVMDSSRGAVGERFGSHEDGLDSTFARRVDDCG